MVRHLAVLPLLLLACSPAKTPTTQEPPAASASASAVTSAAATAPAATSTAKAPDTPAADAVAGPPDEATIAKRFLGDAPLAHVNAYVVDETCLLDGKIPEAAHKHMLSTISIDDFQEGEMHRRSANTNDASPEALKSLRAFVATFPKGAHHFSIQRFAFTFDGKTTTSWRAYCMKPTPLFTGAADMGRVKRKDGTFDTDTYRVGFSPAALAKVRALPKDAWRIAILWDEDLVILLPVPELRELKNPTVGLVALPK